MKIRRLILIVTVVEILGKCLFSDLLAAQAKYTASFYVANGRGNSGDYWGLDVADYSAKPDQCACTPIYGVGFNITNQLTPGALYGGVFKQIQYVDTYYGMAVTVNNIPDCYNLSCIADTGAIGTKAASVHFTLGLVPKNILFKWDFPTAGLQSLIADGQSTVHGSATNASGSLTWSFNGDTLGCTLVGDNSGVTVTAGTNTGTVNIHVTSSTGACYELPLDIADCSACQNGACENGGFSVANSSVDMKIGLGWALLGNTAGYLRIKETYPTNTIATPRGLRYPFKRAEVEVYTNLNGLSQIKSLELFANIVTNNASSYSIGLFHLTNVLAYTNGGYQLRNSAYRTITVENPSANTNEVLITDSNDGSTYDYTWQGSGWKLSTGGGLRDELRTTSFSGSLSTATTTIQSGASAPVFSKVQVYQSSGSYNNLRLLSETFGTGGAARSNTYSYTANGFVQQVVRSDGTWEYYRYDSFNRATNIFSGFGYQGVTTNSSLCRLLVNDYSTNAISGAGDNGKFYFNTPRSTVEYLQGTEISRRYFIGLAAERREIQCTTSGAAWNDTNNLVTTYRLFTDGFRLNEPWAIIHPDGTAELFEYGPIGPPTTNIVTSGHLDGSGTNVGDGTRTISILGASGQVVSKTTVDIKSGIPTAIETYGYDEFNRLTTTTYLDGTSFQTHYDCCTVDSQTNRDGTVTTFTHDALKRLLTTTVNGITTSNIYDPAGNILAVYRFGSNGAPVLLSQATFDDGGQKTSSTDALGHTTYYDEHLDGSGQLIRQTTFPDTGVRNEFYGTDGALLGVSGSAAFPVTNLYGADGSGKYQQEIKLASGGGKSEWTKTYADAAGRRYKTIFASASGSPYGLSRFNSLGQLTNTVDPDGVSTLYAYNPLGELAYTVLDSNRNYTVDFSGQDRITFVTNDFAIDNGTYVRRARTYVWNTAADSSTLISTAEISTDGLQGWNTIWNGGVAVTSRMATSYDPVHGYRFVTNTAPDGSYTVATSQYGRLLSVGATNAVGGQIGGATYGYDAHGRQNTVSDFRNGTTTRFYNNADEVSGMITPSPDGVLGGQVTTNYFDSRGRVWKTSLPDNTSVTNEFYLTGNLKRTSGSRTYPVGYEYDAQGRMKTMTNWNGFAANTGARVTTWNYDAYRGFLTGKVYDGGAPGPSYTYTDAGRLATRLWARGTNTTYTYSYAGDLASASYNDGSTPTAEYGYDRRGRQNSITKGSAVCTLGFNDAGGLLSEAYAGGPLDGISITNGYDALLRRTNNVTLHSGTILTRTTNSFDAASRLEVMSDGTNSATYTYLANSPLVSQIVFKQNATTRMTTIKVYDYLNRLKSISSVSSATTNSFAYSYNNANQRTGVTNVDSSKWVYEYDSLGQVISGKKYWSDGTPVAGQQFEYTFDDIGNRTATKAGGDQSGGSLRSASYSANNLNQYDSRTVPGAIDIIGSATNTATVTVNNQATYRKGNYFRDQLSLINSSAAVWAGVTNVAVLNNGTNPDIIATNLGYVFLPKTPETFTYDDDGNLKQDGRWQYTWDGENRLVGMTSLTNAPAGSKLKLDFAYDFIGRRVQKLVSTNNGTDYFPLYTNRFVYDGWNLLAELNPANGVIRSFMRGTDLSGALKGAGGVGGLLTVSDAALGASFASFDGNGNVSEMFAADNGGITGRYEYGPIGEVTRATGPMAKANPFRWSTQHTDDETDLVMYPARPYNPSTGRFLCKDPIGEQGGLNLYVFCGNSPVNRIDPFGLDDDSSPWLLGLSLPTSFSVFD